MYQATLITWMIILFGLITCTPLLVAQLFILLEPKGKKAKDILIGKDEEWRDRSHFKSAYSLAVTDWVVFFPFLTLSITGIFFNQYWGYLFLSISGAAPTSYRSSPASDGSPPPKSKGARLANFVVQGGPVGRPQGTQGQAPPQ